MKIQCFQNQGVASRAESYSVQTRTGPWTRSDRTGPDRTEAIRSGPRSKGMSDSVLGPVPVWTGGPDRWTEDKEGKKSIFSMWHGRAGKHGTIVLKFCPGHACSRSAAEYQARPCLLSTVCPCYPEKVGFTFPLFFPGSPLGPLLLPFLFQFCSASVPLLFCLFISSSPLPSRASSLCARLPRPRPVVPLPPLPLRSVPLPSALARRLAPPPSAPRPSALSLSHSLTPSGVSACLATVSPPLRVRVYLQEPGSRLVSGYSLTWFAT